MASLIETLSFTSVDAVTYDFKGDGNDVQVWVPTLATRGQTRPRMQMHGSNARRLFFDGLTIDHEGQFIADTQEEVVAERDALLAALLGDLSAPPDATKLGTLTVKYLGWAETATADVAIDSYQAGFAREDLLTLAYQIQWRCDLPYFVGDDSDDPVPL